jgi:glycosyltransferase involved in cell wall biosynthesis
VRAFYGAADVLAYPRVSHHLTDMVTPLKPLEAMAQRRPVVASDVGGHKELIEDGRTGFLFPTADESALARTLIRVLENPSGAGDVVGNARRMVEAERRWSVVAQRYLPVYERLVGIRARKSRDGRVETEVGEERRG